jgi:hypothetical protein
MKAWEATMEQAHQSPEQLLYTDDQGNRVSVDEVMLSGMEGRYQNRVPALRDLMKAPGDPLQRFEACFLLASWGDVEGLWQLTAWAQRPDQTPWGHGGLFDHRLYGSDQTYEQLARALAASLLFDKTPERQAAQIAAAKALLRLAPSYVFDFTLHNALVREDAWLVPEVRDELHWAVEESVRAIEEHRYVDFILEIQTGTLLALLAAIDDKTAAALAERWLATFPDEPEMVNRRLLGDVLGALKNGGPRCLALLEWAEERYTRQGS